MVRSSERKEYEEFIHSILQGGFATPLSGVTYTESKTEYVKFYANAIIAQRKMKEYEQYGWKCGVLYRSGEMEMVECTRTWEDLTEYARRI